MCRLLLHDGLTDSTLVVFWSDHGMGMPRGKRWIYDTGTRIPMIIRWPGKVWRQVARAKTWSACWTPPTMDWQQQIGDSGMIPEAVLMEEMFPSGIAPTTQRATIAFDRDNVVSLGLPNRRGVDCLSTAQRPGLERLDTLHQALFRRPNQRQTRDQDQAQASRLGFETSPVVESR